MKRQTPIVKLAYAFVFLSQLFLVSQLKSAETPALRGVYNALGGTMAVVWVAQDLGLFTKHGLQHSLNYLAATTAVQAIAAGSEDIGLVGNQGIDLGLEGADTVYIADTASRFIFQLYGDASIKSVADLKGKVVAATQPAASSDYALRMLLRRNNLVPDKDVKIIYAGSSPALLSMLKGGNAVAGLMTAPATYAAQEVGLKQIVNVTDLNIPFIFVGVATTRRVLQQKPDAIMRYLRGYTEAISVVLRDKETALKIMGKYMKMDNRQQVEAVYNEHAPVLQRVPCSACPTSRTKWLRRSSKWSRAPRASTRSRKFSMTTPSCRNSKPAVSSIRCMRASYGR
jgi:ABC-type nitrate/sulfonate/bicarbonate transport system substrate-binding protein